MKPRMALLVAIMFGFGIGGMFGAAVALHFATAQADGMVEQMKNTTATWQDAVDKYAQAVKNWQERATTCEARCASYTVVYEKQDLATVPVLNGALAVAIRAGGNMSVKPSLYVPAQVEVYTNRGDVYYEWINSRTGQSSGMRLPHSPAEDQ